MNHTIIDYNQVKTSSDDRNNSPTATLIDHVLGFATDATGGDGILAKEVVWIVGIFRVALAPWWMEECYALLLG